MLLNLHEFVFEGPNMKFAVSVAYLHSILCAAIRLHTKLCEIWMKHIFNQQLSMCRSSQGSSNNRAVIIFGFHIKPVSTA